MVVESIEVIKGGALAEYRNTLGGVIRNLESEILQGVWI
jgi:hypothetical protein